MATTTTTTTTTGHFVCLSLLRGSLPLVLSRRRGTGGAPHRRGGTLGGGSGSGAHEPKLSQPAWLRALPAPTTTVRAGDGRKGEGGKNGAAAGAPEGRSDSPQPGRMGKPDGLHWQTSQARPLILRRSCANRQISQAHLIFPKART